MNSSDIGNSRDIFGNLTNDYFLIRLFGYLSEKKSLDIMKYNKKIQKRININVNNYKEYSEKYSSIEIEIKPANNRFRSFVVNSGYYYKFININKGDEKYYHIFFGENQEMKRNY